MYDGRVYIPPAGNLRQRVVAAVHDSLPAGHPGPARTIELLRRTHDFPGSRRFVRTYVRSCDTCQRAKVATHAPYGLLKPNEIPTRPWQHISMDFIVKLPISNGFDSVLHGLPTTIISDRGSVFTSQFWTSVLNLVGVEPRHSTAYHPQTDGQTERKTPFQATYGFHPSFLASSTPASDVPAAD
ncbi:unnamed protein product, partial [Tilletia caries]